MTDPEPEPTPEEIEILRAAVAEARELAEEGQPRRTDGIIWD